MSPDRQDHPAPPDRFRELLGQRSDSTLDSKAMDGLAGFLTELDAWRQRINLTGRLSGSELVEHALEVIPALDLIAAGTEVIDIGAGGGLPAIPLAILRSKAKFTLVEPAGKKVAFLRHVARTLSLENVSVEARRLADVGARTWDLATTRGVGSLSEVIGSGSFLKPKGRLLVWTTDPERLERDLSSFRLEESRPIPRSRAKRIAILARRD